MAFRKVVTKTQTVSTLGKLSPRYDIAYAKYEDQDLIDDEKKILPQPKYVPFLQDTNFLKAHLGVMDPVELYSGVTRHTSFRPRRKTGAGSEREKELAENLVERVVKLVRQAEENMINLDRFNPLAPPIELTKILEDGLGTFLGSVEHVDGGMMADIIRCMAAKGGAKFALAGFEWLVERFGQPHTIEVFNELILAHRLAHDFEGALQLFARAQEEAHLEPDALSFNLALGVCAEDGYLHHNVVAAANACELFQRMQARSIAPCTHTFRALITSFRCNPATHWQQATSTLALMKETLEETDEDFVAEREYSKLCLKAMTQVGLNEALEIFQALRLFGLHDSLPVYTALLQACVRHDYVNPDSSATRPAEHSAVTLIRDEMSELDDCRSLGSSVLEGLPEDSLGRSRSRGGPEVGGEEEPKKKGLGTEIGLQVFHWMAEGGSVVPDTAAFNLLLEACSNTDEAEDALRVFGWMLLGQGFADNTHVPNSVTFNLLIKVCQRVNLLPSEMEIPADILEQDRLDQEARQREEEIQAELDRQMKQAAMPSPGGSLSGLKTPTTALSQSGSPKKSLTSPYQSEPSEFEKRLKMRMKDEDKEDSAANRLKRELAGRRDSPPPDGPNYADAVLEQKPLHPVTREEIMDRQCSQLRYLGLYTRKLSERTLEEKQREAELAEEINAEFYQSIMYSRDRSINHLGMAVALPPKIGQGSAMDNLGPGGWGETIPAAKEALTLAMDLAARWYEMPDYLLMPTAEVAKMRQKAGDQNHLNENSMEQWALKTLLLLLAVVIPACEGTPAERDWGMYSTLKFGWTTVKDSLHQLEVEKEKIATAVNFIRLGKNGKVLRSPTHGKMMKIINDAKAKEASIKDLVEADQKMCEKFRQRNIQARGSVHVKPLISKAGDDVQVRVLTRTVQIPTKGNLGRVDLRRDQINASNAGVPRQPGSPAKWVPPIYMAYAFPS